MEYLGFNALYVLLFVLLLMTAGWTLRKLGQTLMKELNSTWNIPLAMLFWKRDFKKVRWEEK